VKKKHDAEERRWKNWKHTSCMCHKEACQRALWAHLAQNSIPTWKSDIPSWILWSKFSKNIPNDSPNHKKTDWIENWNHNQWRGLLTAAPTDRANVPNISDQGTSPPYTKTKPNFTTKLSSHANQQSCMTPMSKTQKRKVQNRQQQNHIYLVCL